MPHALPRARVEAEDGLSDLSRALPLAAVPVVARRADGDVHVAARRIHRERRPHVRVAHVLPRIVLPRVVAELAGLGDGLEAPDALARPHVERLDVARRIAVIDEPVADAVAEHDDVAPNHRRRRVGGVLVTDGGREILRDVHFAVAAETRDRLAGGGVERDQAPARVDEDASLAAVGPRRDAAVHEARAVARLAVRLPRLRVEGPQLATVPRVERDHAIVWRREEERVVDRQRRGLELAGARRPLAPARGNRLLLRL